MSEGESRCPLSCRDRKTTESPAISPTRNAADGSPHGLSIFVSRTFSRPGRPHHEGGDVLGVLVHRRRRAIGVVDLIVRKRLAHADRMAGEVLVVLRARRKREILRRVLVALEDRHAVVDAVLLILGENL